MVKARSEVPPNSRLKYSSSVQRPQKFVVIQSSSGPTWSVFRGKSMTGLLTVEPISRQFDKLCESGRRDKVTGILPNSPYQRSRHRPVALRIEIWALTKTIIQFLGFRFPSIITSRARRFTGKAGYQSESLDVTMVMEVLFPSHVVWLRPLTFRFATPRAN